jgi:hypothetical protein
VATCSTTPRRLSSDVEPPSGSSRQARTTNVSTPRSLPTPLRASFDSASTRGRARGRDRRREGRGLDADLAHPGAVGLVGATSLALLARVEVSSDEAEVGVLVVRVVLEDPQVATHPGGRVADGHAVVGVRATQM